MTGPGALALDALGALCYAGMVAREWSVFCEHYVELAATYRKVVIRVATGNHRAVERFGMGRE